MLEEARRQGLPFAQWDGPTVVVWLEVYLSFNPGGVHSHVSAVLPLDAVHNLPALTLLVSSCGLGCLPGTWPLAEPM